MTLGDRLSETRHVRFVGRATELALFVEAMAAGTLPFHVLHVYGPGGSGKTTLLEEYQRHCIETAIPVTHVDARFVTPTPEAFQRVASEAEEGRARTRRRVLLVDTYEAIDALDGWLRRSFLPSMDENLLVVFAGRNRPDPTWLADSGWRKEVKVVPLRNLTPDESIDFLTAREVPAEQHHRVMAFTHGHPLALALAAEHVRQDPATPFTLDDAPDVVQTLLQRFVQEAPSKTRRSALEAASLVRALTEPLLAALMEADDAYETFAWLRGLAFMQEGPNGVFPHDLARDVLVADLQWRDPDKFNALHERARKYCMASLRDATTDDERREAISAYVFLYRTNPIVRPILGALRDEWEKVGRRMVGTLEADDIPVLVAMIAKHEGDESARHAEYWFNRKPQYAQLFRDTNDKAAGFLLTIDLDATTDEERSSDPALETAWQYLRNHAPLRDGDRAIVFRHWMDADAYQGISAVQSLIFSSMVRRYLTTPRLAFSFLPCADDEFWSTIFAFARVHRLPEAAYEIEGRSFAVFGHDWRTEPVDAWMELLAKQAPYSVPRQDEPALVPALLVLSKPDFANAVHDALRGFAQQHKLEGNPLLRSRLVEDRAEAGADTAGRIAALIELIGEALNTMEDAPREVLYSNAVRGTYIRPAPSQAVAAERLDIPFSTYRRHLARGVGLIVEALWRMETA